MLSRSSAMSAPGTLPEFRGSSPDLNQNFEIQKTQIIHASANGNPRIIDNLWRSQNSFQVWRFLQKVHEDNEDRYSPLHIAVVSEHDAVVKAILDGGDPVGNSTTLHLKFDFLHARTSEGWTALHFAVVSGNVAILKMLMTAYNLVAKRPENSWDFADCCWMTPLHYAVLQNRQVQIELLLGWELYHPYVNARDFFQRTPMHMAACHRPLSVKIFVDHFHVDINAVDCVLHSPLQWAICFGRVDVVKCLLEKKLTVRPDLDIERQSVLERAMDDTLVDLHETTMMKNVSQDPIVCDRLFVMDLHYLLHRKVSGEMNSLLLMIPVVKDDIGISQKGLQIYMNAINATLVVAALIASASFGLSSASLGGASTARFNAVQRSEGDVQYSRGSIYFEPDMITELIFSIFISLAFCLAIQALTTTVVALRPLGKTLLGRAQLQTSQAALSRIFMWLGYSIRHFVIAFFIAILAPLYAWVLPMLILPFLLLFGHSLLSKVKRTNQGEQQNSTTVHLQELISKLYSPAVRRKCYWPRWQTHCQNTNAIKAFSACLVSREGFQIDGEAALQIQDDYIQFMRNVFNVQRDSVVSPRTSGQSSHVLGDNVLSSQTSAQTLDVPLNGVLTYTSLALGQLFNIPHDHDVFFSPPTLGQILCMWLWEKLRYIHSQGPTISGIEFRKLVICGLFGDQFTESWSHGRLYSSSSSRARSEVSMSRKDAEFDVPPLRLAVDFWRQKNVSTETIEGFKRMERKLKRIELVYENLSKGTGPDSSGGGKARHFMFFLDRLPRGILYWINIWIFPKRRQTFSRGMLYWMNFWFDGGHAVPTKFPIVTFYQGYVLQRDFEKSRAISDQMERKRAAFASMVTPA